MNQHTTTEGTIMPTKVRTITVHAHYIEIDGVEYETTFPAHEYIDPKVEVEDGKTFITYATLDDYWPWNPIEDDEFIEFEEFDNSWDRDAWAKGWQEAGWTVFFVNHYEHSLSRYSVIEDMTLYRAGWDDRPSGVIALHPDITNPLETAIDTMNTYTAWVNGEVYTLVREEYDAEGVRVDYDSVGGYFGSEHAGAAIKIGAL